MGAEYITVEIPGQGEVEFPAGMSDEEIGAAIMEMDAEPAEQAAPPEAARTLDVPRNLAGDEQRSPLLEQETVGGRPVPQQSPLIQDPNERARLEASAATLGDYSGIGDVDAGHGPIENKLLMAGERASQMAGFTVGIAAKMARKTGELYGWWSEDAPETAVDRWAEKMQDTDFGAARRSDLDTIEKAWNEQGAGTAALELGNMVLELGADSLPYMVAMANPTAMVAATTGEIERIATERAQNDGRKEPSKTDYAVAAVVAPIIMGAEKLGIDKMFGPVVAKTRWGAAAKGAGRGMVGETFTEIPQELLELEATRRYTQAGIPTWRERGRAALEAGIGGAGMGGPMGGLSGAVRGPDQLPPPTDYNERIRRIMDRNLGDRGRLRTVKPGEAPRPIPAGATVAGQQAQAQAHGAKTGNPVLDELVTAGPVQSTEEIVGQAAGEPQTGPESKDIYSAPPLRTAEDRQREIDRATAESQTGPAAPAPASAPAPERVAPVEPPATSGKRETVYSPTNKPVEIEYQLVEAGDMVTSNTAEGGVNPDYPAELQPRDRGRKASAVQINEIAGNLNPDLLGANPSTADGAPIIGEDGVVESGNGRVAAIRLAQSKGGDAGYRQYLTDHAQELGLDPDQVAGMRNPVLVRKRITPMDAGQRQQFTRDSNQSSVAAMSPVEQAKVDAESINMRLLQPDEAGNLAAASNRPFVQAFVKQMPPQERGGMLTADGQPTRQLLDRIRSAVFQKAYGDDRLLAAMAEEADPNIRNILNALVQAAPETVRARAQEADLGELDFVSDVVGGIDLVRKARNENASVDALLRQGGLFGGIDPTQADFAKFMDANMRSARRMGEFFKAVARITGQDLASAKNADMFGVPPLSKQSVIQRAIREVGVEEQSQQQDIFQAHERAPEENAQPDGQGRAGGEQEAAGGRSTGAAEAVSGEEVAEPEGRAYAGRDEREEVSGYGREVHNRRTAAGHGNVDAPGPVQLEIDFSQNVPPKDRKVSKDPKIGHVKTGRFFASEEPVTTPEQAAHTVAQLRKEPQESFVMLALDKDGRPLAVVRNSVGGPDSAPFTPHIVVGAALNVPGVASVYMAHQHPSGEPGHSRQDHAVNTVLTDLFDGTGVDYRGSVVVAGGPKGNQFTYAPLAAAGAVEQSGGIQPRRRTKEVPVTQRRMRRHGQHKEVISSQDKAVAIVSELANGRTGIALLDTGFRPVGFVPMTVDEMIWLRQGKEGSAARLYKAIDKRGATALMPMVPAKIKGGVKHKNLTNNLMRFGKKARLRIPDIVYDDGTTTERGIPFGEDSLPEISGPYYSKGSGKPPRGKTAKILRAIRRAALRLGYPVEVYGNVGDMSAADQAYLKDAPEDIEGVWMPGGRVALFTDNLSGARRAAQVVAHEVVAHEGVRALAAKLGRDVASVYDSIYEANTAEIDAYAEKDGYKTDTAGNRQRATDEWIARQTEQARNTGRIPQAIKRLTAALRDALTKKTGVAWNNREILELLSAAGQVVGEQTGRGGGEARYSASAMKSVKANIRRGREAMNKALLNKTSAHRAMYRAGMGWVDFAWGDEGGQVSTSGKRKGAKGVSHILEARQRKDGLNSAQARDVLFHIVETIARGREIRRAIHDGSERAVLSYDGGEAVLVKNKGSNTWLLAGWKNTGETGAGNDAPASTHQPADSTDRKMGADGETVNETEKPVKGPRYSVARRPAKKTTRQKLRRWWHTQGNLTEDAWKHKVERDNIFNAFELDTARFTALFKKAVRAGYGRNHKLTAAESEEINDYLAGGDGAGVPAATREQADHMRAYLDTLSDNMINAFGDLLRLEIAAQPPQVRQAIREWIEGEQPDSVVPAKIKRLFDLRLIVEGNKGSYLNRSYQVFDDKHWEKRVRKNDGVMQAAREYIRAEYPAGTDVEAETSRILYEAAAKGDMSGLLAGGKLGAKTTSMLKKRKNIPPEIRALLGEYQDPEVNFTRSATKMAHYLAGHNFLMKTREAGLAQGWLTKKPQGKNYAPVGESERTDPMSGLYAEEAFVEALQDFSTQDPVNTPWINWIFKINAWVKVGKTVGSPKTQARNLQSGGFMLAINGHLGGLRHAGKAAAAAWGRQTDAQRHAYARKLVRLGVTHDNARAEEILGALRDAHLQEFGRFSWEAPVRRKARKAFGKAQRAYRFGDDFWKVMGFEAEKAGLIKSGMDRAAAEKLAARRIRDGYPTYSMTPKLIRELRKWPVGAFVAFPWEAARTLVINQPRFAWEDMKAGRKAMAARRIAGAAAAWSAAHALSQATMMMFGIGDEDDATIRELAAPWDKNAQFSYTGFDKQGNPTYINLTYTAPTSQLSELVTALTKGGDVTPVEHVTDAVEAIFEPYLSEDILPGFIADVVRNKSDYGPLWREDATGLEQGLAIAEHAKRKLGPGFLTIADDFYKAHKGEVAKGGKEYTYAGAAKALVGLQETTLNLGNALKHKAGDANRLRRDAATTFSSADMAGSMNDLPVDDLRQGWDRFMRSREKTYGKLLHYVDSLRRMGMDDEALMVSLRGGGIGKGEALLLLEGELPRWSMSAQFLRAKQNQARLKIADPARADAAVQRMEDRKELISDWASEQD